MRHFLLLVLCFVICKMSFTQESDVEQELKFRSPSIEGMLKNFQNQPSKSHIVNQEILKVLIGFPIDTSEMDEDQQPLFRNAHNHEYNLLCREILDMYWTGSLAEEKADSFFQSLFEEEFSKKNHFPLQGFHNLMAVYTSEADEIDSLRVLAAILLSGQLHAIQDIKPYLEYATVYVGNSLFALGAPSSITMSTFGDPEVKLTPLQRLKFWPSACAIFNNTESVVPKLLNAVQDKELREDLRLRAATFLNTIDSSLLGQELLESLEPEIAEQVHLIKEKRLKWRHPISSINKELSKMQQKMLDKAIRELNLPEDISFYEVEDMLDGETWGDY